MKKKIVAWFLLLAMMITLIPAGSVQAATYKKGSKGTNVQYLQQNLTFLGFSTKGVDGKFGNNTRNAVLSLQKNLHVPETGIVDDALDALIKGTVADIQKYLAYKGYYTGEIDGIKGNATGTAYKKLEKNLGLKQTAVVNISVLEKILGDTKANLEMKFLKEWVARIKNEYKDGMAIALETHPTWDEQYVRLFQEYPLCLTNGVFDSYMSIYVGYANDVLYKKTEGTTSAIIMTAFAEGKGIILDELTSLLGLTHTYKETMRLDAISFLIRDMSRSSRVIESANAEVGKAFSQLDKKYSTTTKEQIDKLVNDLAKVCDSLSNDTIKKIVDTILEYDQSKLAKKIGNGVATVDFIVSTIYLYELELELVERLQQTVPTDSDMYSDLVLLEREINKNPVARILAYISSSNVQELICDVLLSKAGVLTFPANIVMMGAEIGIDIFANHIYKGALANEIIQTLLLKSYVHTMQAKLYDIRTEYINNVMSGNDVPTFEDIENYEFVFSAYLAAVKNYLLSAKQMENAGDVSLIRQGLQALDDWANYETYVKFCTDTMKRQFGVLSEEDVQKAMDEVVEVLQGKYFTTTQKACLSKREPSHGCDKCRVSNIVQKTWFKNLFGEVNVDNFPEHYYKLEEKDSSGKSCFGFACFLQWKIYETETRPKVVAERVKIGIFNKSFVESEVKPGDVLRLDDSHSVVVYSIEENGIMVVDCNWNTKNQLNCLVQKHLIPYDNEYYSNQPVYVHRVK